jgi:hypothetical protein
MRSKAKRWVLLRRDLAWVDRVWLTDGYRPRGRRKKRKPTCPSSSSSYLLRLSSLRPPAPHRSVRSTRTNILRPPNIPSILYHYSLRSILLFANTDVSTTKMCPDTFTLAKSIMGRREYYHLISLRCVCHRPLPLPQIQPPIDPSRSSLLLSFSPTRTQIENWNTTVTWRVMTWAWLDIRYFYIWDLQLWKKMRTLPQVNQEVCRGGGT